MTNPVEKAIDGMKDQFSQDLTAIQVKRFEAAPICVGKYAQEPKSCLDVIREDPAFIQSLIDNVGYILFKYRLAAYLRTEQGSQFKQLFTFAPDPTSRKESADASSLTEGHGKSDNRGASEPPKDQNQGDSPPH